MKFQLHIETKMLKNKDSFDLNLSIVVIILLLNVKMPTIVGILAFISKVNFMLSYA